MQLIINNIKASIIYSVLLSSVLFLTGCINVDTEVILHADGSGKVILTEQITGNGIKRLSAMAKTGSIPVIDIADYFTNTTKKELAEETSKFSTGLNLDSVTPIKRNDGTLGRVSVYTFNDINSVRLFNTASGNTNDLSFDYVDNKLRIIRHINSQEEAEIKKIAGYAGNIPLFIKEAIKDISLRITLTPEQTIDSSNASYVDTEHNRITFADIDISKLIATPDALNKLTKLNEFQPEELRKTLKPYSSWLKFEPEKEVTVKFIDRID